LSAEQNYRIIYDAVCLMGDFKVAV